MPIPSRVFTKQGISTLSAVLRNDIIEGNVHVMSAIVKKRHFIASSAQIFERLNAMEVRQLEFQKSTDKHVGRSFDRLDTGTTRHGKRRQASA